MARSIMYCNSLPGFINVFQMILSGVILGLMTHQDVYGGQLVHFQGELFTLLLAALSLALTAAACVLLASPKVSFLKESTVHLCLMIFALELLGWVVAGALESWYAVRLKALMAPEMRALDLRQPHELLPLYHRYHIRSLLAGLSFGNALLYAGSLLLVPAHVSQQGGGVAASLPALRASVRRAKGLPHLHRHTVI